jgi:hypothetical protein
MREVDRRKVWVRAGGRCALCGDYLLDGDIGSPDTTIGEAAHIKGKRRGRRKSERSSRSARHEFLLPGEDADDPDNVMLLCRPHHTQIDAEVNAGTIDVETLRGIKSLQERRTLQATAMAVAERTVVIRVIGDLYGDTIQCSRLEATGACMRASQRIPDFALALDHATIECDLRGLAGERAGEPEYFASACRAIDELVGGKLRDGVATDHIGHLSVFAFARLPLLVYLGARLGDAISSDVYQRSRVTESWDWPDSDLEAGFTVDAPEASEASEAVVLVNLSGTVHRGELPEALHGMPTYEVCVDANTVADANVIRSQGDLKRFEVAFYELLARIEERHKTVQTLHLVAAAPLSAAVSIGRTINSQVFDSIAVYHRDGGSYEEALRL